MQIKRQEGLVAALDPEGPIEVEARQLPLLFQTAPCPFIVATSPKHPEHQPDQDKVDPPIEVTAAKVDPDPEVAIGGGQGLGQDWEGESDVEAES